MKPIDLITELKKRNNLLFWFGWFNTALFILAITMMIVDDTQIAGINAWIKPSKFALSIIVYAWTFAWLLHYLPNSKNRKFISVIVVICMLVENTLIFIQAFRGVRSHFNIATSLDSAIFSIMGMLILVNTVIIFYTIALFFTEKIELSATALLAWRAGLIFFFLGGISGGAMSAMLTHSVGTADGGPGLPFVNWSTVAGDIRSAHFFTLHGLQVIPLASVVFTRLSGDRARSATLIFIVAYLGVCLWLHWLAFHGLPVLQF